MHCTGLTYYMRPRQKYRHFADDIFKCIFLNENICIPIKISLKFVPGGPIGNIQALVQIMAWRRPGDKPLSEPMMDAYLRHSASMNWGLVAINRRIVLCMNMYRKKKKEDTTYWSLKFDLVWLRCSQSCYIDRANGVLIKYQFTKNKHSHYNDYSIIPNQQIHNIITRFISPNTLLYNLSKATMNSVCITPLKYPNILSDNGASV